VTTGQTFRRILGLTPPTYRRFYLCQFIKHRGRNVAVPAACGRQPTPLYHTATIRDAIYLLRLPGCCQPLRLDLPDVATGVADTIQGGPGVQTNDQHYRRTLFRRPHTCGVAPHADELGNDAKTRAPVPP